MAPPCASHALEKPWTLLSHERSLERATAPTATASVNRSSTMSSAWLPRSRLRHAPIAFLHDVIERSHMSVDDLRREGLTPTEVAAAQLLALAADESFELHVLSIKHAPGAAGRLARCVKLADLDDHLAQGRASAGAPTYAWARRHVAIGRERYDGVMVFLPPAAIVAAPAA